MSTPSFYNNLIPGTNFGVVKEVTPANYVRPASGTAYAVGDIIGNSATAESVTPITFLNAARNTGNGATLKILAAQCVVLPASGALTVTAFDFDLLLFRPVASIPFAAAGYPADNAALVVTQAMYQQLVAVIPFVAGAWRGPTGAVTSQTGAAYQAAVPLTMNPSPVDLSDLTSASLIGVLQAKGTWASSNVVHTFTFNLLVDQN